MDNRAEKVAKKRKLAVITLITGLLTCTAGAALEIGWNDPPFNTRIITGLGIFFVGLGIAALAGYLAVRGKTKEAARLLNVELDERLQLVRLHAGSRAFWVSLSMAYLGLLWVSFASNGSLPALNDDAIWWLLTALVVLPFAVYAAGMIIGQNR
jgi:ABC-type uncharacterized transport system permease subunit